MAHGWSRLRAWAPMSMSLRWGAAAVAAVAAGTGWAVWSGGSELPTDVHGTLVFVSNRSGLDALYVRRLPDGRDRRVTHLDEPVQDPALSPDGKRVAFSVGGRIGVVDVSGGSVRILTLGREWRDSVPAWRGDGGALVVEARRSETATSDVHLLTLVPGLEPRRQPVTETAHLDEAQPAFSKDGNAVVFVREDNLYRLDLAGLRPRRLTGGFRKVRSPRLLPSGRVLFLWTEEKQYGIDVVDLDGKNRETLHTGSTFYRTAVPSPDGRYLAATFTFDLAFDPWAALGLPQREELHLVDLRGARVAEVAASWRHANHTADWRR